MKTRSPHKIRDDGAYIRRAQLTVEVLLQGKWQVHILSAMRDGSVRIGHLGRLIPGASKKMLAQSLRRLEANGIVVRKDLSELVLHVEYELEPEIKESVIALLDRLSDWGAHFLETEGQRGSSRKLGDTSSSLLDKSLGVE
jgi:DNA-binding HxlR family transcriptional regulator